MPIRYEFERELNELHRNLVKMGATIEKQIDDMIKAMLNQDVELAREVIKRDDIIDEMERIIEQECIMLIARQQPIASDLRDIASILKIITDLERIADHCEDISKYTIKLSKETYFKPLEDIPKMAYKVKDMIKAVIDSCISKNLARAEEVKAMDDEIDDLFDTIIEELQTYMMKDSTVVKQCTDFMFIVKYLERMGDHATNISEWIAYNITGKHFE
ncbi:phosphate signaling complex protein PhoU [Petrocella sp. FN5]|uniref:phosphate signaling complex protein PhoU n=1 Tax=Petrocella sp. FN5 TaxID=3032002 RepID=UPI0023DBB01E|nr:phosphate signaling complex protein PhoU [Petrocella sp. FN5]MDF1616197.1 phosphate signaling complex protein PhoU [Petrocella sp. FN5]